MPPKPKPKAKAKAKPKPKSQPSKKQIQSLLIPQSEKTEQDLAAIKLLMKALKKEGYTNFQFAK